MFARDRLFPLGLALLAICTLTAVAVQQADGQTDSRRGGTFVSIGTDDLATLVEECGAAEPGDQSLEADGNDGKGLEPQAVAVPLPEPRPVTPRLAAQCEERHAALAEAVVVGLEVETIGHGLVG